MEVTEQDSWLEGIGVSIAGTLGGVAQKAEGLVSDVAGTVSSAVGGLTRAVEGAAASTANVASAVTQEAQDASSGFVRGVSTGFRAVRDAGASAFGAIGDVAGEVAEGVKETATTVADAASDVADDVVAGAESLVQGVEDTASDLYQKAKDAVAGIDLPYQFSGVQAPFEKALEDAADDGVPVEARALTSGELADAKLIFGDSLDYSKIMVDGCSVASVGACRTIGNTVHLTRDMFKAGTSETTTEGKRTLVHELTHVWQYQHQGWTYAPKALWAQAKAAVQGSRNGAYDWKTLVAKGIPWDEWNPEAQAEAVEEYNIALHKVNDGTVKREDYEALDVLAKYVRNVGSNAAAEQGARDPVFNCATDMHGEVNVESDGSWTCSWSWTYVGTTLYDSLDICDEFMLTDESGRVFDAITGKRHNLSPGQTYLASGQGKRKVPSGEVKWKLTIPYKDGYVGVASGSCSPMVAAA